jgi:hypothetical protein
MVDVEFMIGADSDWVMDAYWWTGTVLKEVTERLGPDDADLCAFADNVFARANAQIDSSRLISQRNQRVDWKLEGL